MRPGAGGASTGEESVLELARRPVVREWTAFLTGLFALAGLGIGVLAVLWYDVVDESIWTIPAGIGVGSIAELVPFLAIVLGPFIGAFLGRTIAADDRATTVAAAVATFVATLVLFVLSTVLTAISADALSVDFATLLVVGVLAGLVVAAVAVGGVRLARRRSPSDW